MHDWIRREYGDRFVYRYHQHHQRPIWRQVIQVILGIGIILLGIPLIPLPGPGWIIIFIGLGFISGEILWIAKLMDMIDGTIVKGVVAWYNRSRWSLLLTLWILFGITIYLSWNYGPAWHIDALYWGDLDKTIDEINDQYLK